LGTTGTEGEEQTVRIDLHVHTWPRSQCSSIDPTQLLEKAKQIGLDGFCLTEHQVLWKPAEVEELAQGSGIKIFRGNEITTAQGDVLVFGLDEDVEGVITVQELQKRVEVSGGFSIAAHPFRGFKVFGIGQLEMSVDQACKKKVLKYVDAIEIGNGKVSEQEDEMARRVSRQLGMTGTVGSDAHRIEELGTWVTVFERDVQDERDLVSELRAGRFTTTSGR
jgi:predicted metal-dependent phosphoesterase TrpH